MALLFLCFVLGCSALARKVDPPAPNYDLAGVWVKHDRAVLEIFHINVTCIHCCPASPKCLPTFSGRYLDGELAGLVTFNVTMVGDLMSGTGTYANFADDKSWCPAPFALILEDDTNVALVSYGQSIGTPCGDYTGDSARYYRKSALN